MTHTSPSPTSADTRPAAAVMIATFAVGALGVFVGFSTINADPPSLRWACLLAVGGGGLLSFIRHSLLHRSDAARMGWDFGTRNNFQIEVGLANLAWGAVAVLVVALGLGLAAEATLILVFGVYLGSVTIMQIFFSGGQGRSLPALIGIGSFAVLLLALGVQGVTAA